MSLTNLPGELVILIAEQLDIERDMCSFAQASQKIYKLIGYVPYKHNYIHQNGSAFLWACRNGIERSASISIRYHLHTEADMKLYNEGLLLVCERGYGELAKLLLQQIHTTNQPTLRSIDQALVAAAQNGHMQIAQMLLQHGANADLGLVNGVRNLSLADMATALYDGIVLKQLFQSLWSSTDVYEAPRVFNGRTVRLNIQKPGDEYLIHVIVHSEDSPIPAQEREFRLRLILNSVTSSNNLVKILKPSELFIDTDDLNRFAEDIEKDSVRFHGHDWSKVVSKKIGALRVRDPHKSDQWCAVM